MQIQSEAMQVKYHSQSDFHINSQIGFGFMGERDCIKKSNVNGNLFIDNSQNAKILSFSCKSDYLCNEGLYKKVAHCREGV